MSTSNPTVYHLGVGAPDNPYTHLGLDEMRGDVVIFRPESQEDIAREAFLKTVRRAGKHVLDGTVIKDTIPEQPVAVDEVTELSRIAAATGAVFGPNPL